MILKWSVHRPKFLTETSNTIAQDKEGILPVATLSIALYVLHGSRPASDVAQEVAILLSGLLTSINSVNFQEPQS